MLDIICEHCGRTLKIPEEYLGQKGKCNHCQGEITVLVAPLKFSAEAIQAAAESDQEKPSIVVPWLEERGKAPMNVKGVLAALGGLLFFGAWLLVTVPIAVVIILGSAWASSTLLPWFSVLTRIAFGLVVFVFLPLAIPRATRPFSIAALFISSYVFGATLWMESLLLTFLLWGAGAVFIGWLTFVGCAPIGMLATLLNGMWGPLIELVLLTIMTFASRFGAWSLTTTLEG